MKNTMSAAKRCRRCGFLIEEPAYDMRYLGSVPLCQCPPFRQPLRAGSGIELMRPNTTAIQANQADVRLFYAEQPHVEPIICAATGKPCDPRCDNRCRLSQRDSALVESIMGNGPPATDTSTTRTHTADRLIYLCYGCGGFPDAPAGWPACTCETPDTPGGHYAWVCGRCHREYPPERIACDCTAKAPAAPSAAPPTESACESCWPESCAATPREVMSYDTIDRSASGDGISCRHCKGYTQAPAKWAEHLGKPVMCVCARCRSCGERAHPGGRCRTSLFGEPKMTVTLNNPMRFCYGCGGFVNVRPDSFTGSLVDHCACLVPQLTRPELEPMHPAKPQGWLCPRCDDVNAPWVEVCPCMPAEIAEPRPEILTFGNGYARIENI